jgi:hypothetical protein
VVSLPARQCAPLISRSASTRRSAKVLMTDYRIEMGNLDHYTFLIRSSVMEALAASALSARF